MGEDGGIGVATEPGDSVRLSAMGAGGDAKGALEGLGEGELAAVPDLEGDLRKRRVGLVQQGGGVDETGAHEIALGRLAHHLTEAGREGGSGERDLGGEEDSTGVPPALDSRGNLYISGITTSPDFPVTPGAIQPTYGGGDSDGIVVKVALPR
jgi:hypothetical protein